MDLRVQSRPGLLNYRRRELEILKNRKKDTHERHEQRRCLLRDLHVRQYRDEGIQLDPYYPRTRACLCNSLDITYQLIFGGVS